MRNKENHMTKVEVTNIKNEIFKKLSGIRIVEDNFNTDCLWIITPHNLNKWQAIIRCCAANIEDESEIDIERNIPKI